MIKKKDFSLEQKVLLTNFFSFVSYYLSTYPFSIDVCSALKLFLPTDNSVIIG